MKREVAVGIVVIALLVVGGLILLTNQSRALLDTQATVTAQSNTLDAQARNSRQIAALATQADSAAAETQSALESGLATNQAVAEATATQAAGRLAEFATNAGATQSALEDEMATRQAEAETAATQAAEEQADALSTQSALADELAARQTEAASFVSTATQAAAEALDAQDNLESQLNTLEARIAVLSALVTQAVETSANQSAMVSAAVTAQAQSEATIAALESDLATALAQPAVLVPTQVETVSTPATRAPLEATPIASVEVGSLTYYEAYNQDTAWFIGEIEGAGSASLVDGQYVVTIDTVPSSATIFSPQVIADGFVEVEVALDDCPADALFGLLMRVQQGGSGGYLFAFPCNLSFWAIVAFQEGARPLVLNSGNVLADAATRWHVIGVQMAGSSLTLYLDGALLGAATDRTFREGIIGVYSETVSSQSVVRFDNLYMWELP